MVEKQKMKFFNSDIKAKTHNQVQVRLMASCMHCKGFAIANSLALISNCIVIVKYLLKYYRKTDQII